MSEEQAVSTEPEKQAEDEVKEKAKALPAFLNARPDAPTETQIEAWKAKFDEVFVSGFSEEELFVWRPVFRPEYLLLQREATDQQTGVIDQPTFETLVCETCVLYNSTKRSVANGKAGTASTLAEQILQNSNFIPAQMAMLLVAKL